MRILCEACGAVAEARRVARPGGVALACAACGAEAELPPDGTGAPSAPAAAADPGDEASWESLVARWDDEAAHRRYLDAQEGLAGLARAGARYREVLAARPGDAAALRGRDEVLRRATARGLAALPRATPPRVPSGRAKWIALGALGALVLGAAAWTLGAALRAGAGR